MLRTAVVDGNAARSQRFHVAFVLRVEPPTSGVQPLLVNAIRPEEQWKILHERDKPVPFQSRVLNGIGTEKRGASCRPRAISACSAMFSTLALAISDQPR